MTNKGLALVRSLVVSKIGRKGRRNDAAKPRRRGGKDYFEAINELEQVE